jgi:hypothetical protein
VWLGSYNPARKRTYTFAPVTSHTLQRVHRIRDERVRAVLRRVRDASRIFISERG